MLYLYDDAIIEDLRKSFNPAQVPNPAVSVVNAEQIIDIAAQIQDDKLQFPLVSVYRKSDMQIDSQRQNFTRRHRGVCTVIDHETNNLYYEKMIPVNFSYEITTLCTNTVDQDELIRELLFKYSDMYFLTIQLPYESDRRMRFGLSIDESAGIERKSGLSEYLESGQLYQSTITLNVEGGVLLEYTPVHLKRTEYEITPVTKHQADNL